MSCGKPTAQNCRSYPGRACCCHQDTPSRQKTTALHQTWNERKEGRGQTELKLLTKDHLKKNYPLEEWVHVFTGGSQENVSNAGYGLNCIFFEESYAMEPSLSSFNAEVKEIVRAVEKIAGTANFPLRITKFSSCRTARRPSSPSPKRKTAMS
jgi:hypothetical protein